MVTTATLTIQRQIYHKDDESYLKKLEVFIHKLESLGWTVDVTSEDEFPEIDPKEE